MDAMDPAVAYEIEILSQEYSPLRRNWYKWRCSRKSGQPLDVVTQDEIETMVAIENKNFTDMYKVSDLEHRSRIRRDGKLFSALLKLW
jgi:hypothetical protein